MPNDVYTTTRPVFVSIRLSALTTMYRGKISAVFGNRSAAENKTPRMALNGKLKRANTYADILKIKTFKTVVEIETIILFE